MDMVSRRTNVEGFDPAIFQTGDKMLQPAYCWDWNDKLTKEGIANQLDDMLRAGIRTLYVLAEPKQFRAYTKRFYCDPDYLTDEFFDLLRWTAQEADRRGMYLWLYDEGGWPSGMACGQVTAERPELCRKSVDTREVSLKQGEAYAPGDRAIAAFAGDDMVQPGYVMPQDGTLTEYYVRWHGGMNVDSLDSDIGEAFIKSTHERYSTYFADLLKDGQISLMFTDEPSAGNSSWPRGFEEAFEARYGYDVRPYLTYLFDTSREATGQALQARMDYRQLAGDMFQQNFFAPIRRWCERNHALSVGHLDFDHRSDGCMAHNYGTTLQQLREMDIPGVDVIWQQITLPSADGHIADLSRQSTKSDPAAAANRPCAEGNSFFPRFASSAAAQGGGKYALSESFAVYGGGLDGDTMRYVVNYQLVRGINLFNFMSISYHRGDAIGLIARPDFIPQWPGYEHFAAINAYTARASYLMQLGESAVDSAVYFPARDIWAGGSTAKQAMASFERIGDMLERSHADFDVIDDYAIRQATLEDGALKIGLATYRHIAVPDCAFMPSDVRQKLSGLDGHIPPLIASSEPNLRVKKRNLPTGGSVWMLFNEAGQDMATTVTLPAESLCRLDPYTGKICRAENPVSLNLKPGEALFLLADVAVPCADEPRCTVTLPVTDFTLRPLRRCHVTAAGLQADAVTAEPAPCTLGGWASALGSDFSGEAAYEATVTLPRALNDDDTCVIDLGRVEVSARVYVNDVCVGLCSAHPMRVSFAGSLLNGQTTFRLRVEVANTLANACAAVDFNALFPAEEIGPYHQRDSAIERYAKRGGLYGPVILCI